MKTRSTAGVPLPNDVKDRCDRGRARMRDGAPLANECLRFMRGDQFVWRNKDNVLVDQAVAGGRAPDKAHRMRTVRNVLIDVVAQEVAAATQRVPSYEVSPSTTDPEDISAGRLAEKVALYGYDRWRIREATVRWVTYAVVADEGFVWPYFDNTLGDSIDGEVSTGEVRVRVYGRNQVCWEPGMRFEESLWHAVEYAEPIESVTQRPGFLGGELEADATDADASDGGGGKLVLVTHYLERPTPKTPAGRHITIANGRQVFPAGDYPCRDGNGTYVDEPVLHKLAYFIDPEADRDMGLFRFLLDSQRTINDCTNKQLEWKNLALNPQVLAPVGSLRTRLSDEPGAVFEFVPVGGVAPQWRQTPQMPPELSRLKDEAKADIQAIAAQNSIPSQVESGDAITALIEKDANRRQAFIAQLAEVHSRLMRHCLYLVQRHYTEARLLKIRGRFGPETIPDFLGADLRGQADVTVMPGSIEPRTRKAIEQRVMAFADRQWISPQAAMAAINNGTAESLVESYELDVSRANLVIQKIRAFGATGDQLPVPREFDNIQVHKAVLADWMKTTDFDSAPPFVQEAAELYYQALKQLESQQQAEQAAAQEQMAQSLGMANASRPQGPSPTPDQPAPSE